ncbi:YuiB family protein [Paenibacillus sp.]|uniref:YuiB family protein n=1 Tax=Paenibacillus sp. TaxID=58172 RepID=UPI002D35B53D|nr:YuiB family protein [Paenibacillus sp.]HZG57559.1 YuiB family protein [Paenibacillus sp.]
MVTNVFQVLVIALLAFVLMFGVGFILNMLLKTTWFPIYGYMALMIGLFLYFEWGADDMLANLSEYGFIDWLAVAGGLAGAYVSGVTIRTLRVRGFKMF